MLKIEKENRRTDTGKVTMVPAGTIPTMRSVSQQQLDRTYAEDDILLAVGGHGNAFLVCPMAYADENRLKCWQLRLSSYFYFLLFLMLTHFSELALTMY
jgi:hypothetical protein